jgi:hypothetical protein
MREMNRRTSFYGLTRLVVAVVFFAGCHDGGHKNGSTLSPQDKEDAVGFKEFADRVNDYVKIHNAIESGLPTAKPTDLPEAITAHQQALARKIRESRPDAKIGDIFTPAARKSFKHVIDAVMLGPKGSNAEATMTQGAPFSDANIELNQTYPEKVPFTTVPPTLLAALPKLPDALVYRVVGHDLILLDLKANLVVDFTVGIIP